MCSCPDGYRQLIFTLPAQNRRKQAKNGILHNGNYSNPKPFSRKKQGNAEIMK